jgi:LysR family transcriptional regulator (chromosome initiation inhibitor)
VSQRVKALEQRLGRVLLVRSRPVAPTDSGVAVVRYARQLSWLEATASADLGLSDDDRPQTLSIAVNADSLSTWFLAALAEVSARVGVAFELHREDQDYTDELLRHGLAMAAVSSSPKPVQGCSVRRLGLARYAASATPEFARRWIADRPPAEVLGAAPVVVFNRKDDLQDVFLRRLGTASTGIRHYVPATDAFLEAVELGLGWGLIPEVQAARRSGAPLVDLAPGMVVDVPLYWQQWKLASPALTAVGEAVAAKAREVLVLQERTPQM